MPTKWQSVMYGIKPICVYIERFKKQSARQRKTIRWIKCEHE